MSSTSARRRTARARRPLPPPADRAMASTSARRRSARGPAAQTFLPDEIWEEIFLLLDAAADLARASAACSTFRRIVSERRFLRRFRSLRSPAVLGLITSSRYRPFSPVGPPHRSAPEARALELAADFTFSFLPDPSAWRFRHARDGRVLLSRGISTQIQLEDFLVCDPLHRRYVQIPRIPVDLLAASTPDNGMKRYLLPVLAPAGENDEEESFRVICTVQHKGKGKALLCARLLVLDILSHGLFANLEPTIELGFGSTWRIHGSEKDFSRPFPDLRSASPPNAVNRIEASEMKFSVIDLPPYNRDSVCAIVEAEEGRLGFLTIGDGTIDLYCKNWQSNGVGAQEWLHNKLIPLPKESGINYRWETHGTAGRYLALVAYQGICDESLPNSEHFVLDMKTLLVEKLCTSNNGMFYVFPYAGFPPLLALPSI